MNARKTLLRAAVAAAVMAAGSAVAQVGGIEQEGGIQTPRSIETPVFNQHIPSGVNAIPRADNPQNPNEAKPFVQQPEGVRPLVRGAPVYPAPAPVPPPQAYGPVYGPAAAPYPQPYPAQGPRPMARGDNPNLPNPVTPSAANESAPQPVIHEPTNSTGMEGAPVGATR
ncbi:MAG TPA: hypothetical protein VHP37_15690 [Burkholderiales bacterium]|nr:hypothetical protein [Burkholderiales bacterium]